MNNTSKSATAVNKEADGTITLEITIPKEQIAKVREEVVSQTVTSANIPGFRKGKAPKKIVEDSISTEKLNEEILKKLLPDSYIATVQKQNLKPIINPKIHVNSVTPGEDWTYTAITCEIPEITLGKYKETISKVTAKSKIILPGQEKTEPNFDDIMKALIDSVTVQVPNILVEQEVDRLLSQMLQEIKTLGLTLDQYLASTKKTPDELRKDYGTKAENDIKIEFTLQKIADEEKISVEEKEIEEAISKATSPEERTHLESNRYLLTSIIRQQKTLDFLKTL
jgi:FKBP-type peptidyl-prolyl cis-trans isomerase (trigger factor)